MTKAIRINQHGGPEVMQLVDIEVGEPGSGEIRLQQKACGINFIDAYFRTGLYKQPLPTGLGREGAGIVEAVGPDVHHVKVGDRVAYASGRLEHMHNAGLFLPMWSLNCLMLLALKQQLPSC